MTFEEILDQALAMLQRRGRLTYGTLKRQFQLDDAALDDLKEQLTTWKVSCNLLNLRKQFTEGFSGPFS